MNNNGASILSPGEITDLPSLVTKLNQPSDEVSQYLIGRFSEATRELLSAYTPGGAVPEALKPALAKELAAVIKGDSIFEAHRFAGVTLSPNTQKCLGQELQGPALVRFNRLLLEDGIRRRRCGLAM